MRGGSSLAWLLLIGAATGLFVAYDQSGHFHQCVMRAQQNCVIDGDTIRYRGVTIRLDGIDAPETRDYKCAAEAALGRRATQRLVALMNEGPFDVARVGALDEDRYGRKLRVIMRDGQSLGDILIAEGLARRWDGGRRGWC